MKNVVVDWEWVNLLKEARALGLTKEDIREFFQAAKRQETFSYVERHQKEAINSDLSATFGTPKTL